MYGEALESLTTIGDQPEVARVHCEMGWTALAAGDVPVAQRAFQLGVRANEEVGSPRGLASRSSDSRRSKLLKDGRNAPSRSPLLRTR